MSSADIQALRGELRAVREVLNGLLLRLEQAEARLGEIEEGDVWVPVDSTSNEVDKDDPQGRRTLARELGRFLRRAADGDHQGTSGRDRLKLANRCYLVVADFGGTVLRVPIFTHSFHEVVYVKISSPKTRRRGPSVQYITVDAAHIVPWLESVWCGLRPNDFLYPGTPSAFRSRWDKTLANLGVSRAHKLTPGSLRPGGAVRAHRKQVGIADLMWRMRLQHQKTLSYYLQEVTAMSVLPSLTQTTREKISVLQGALPIFMCHENVVRSALSAMDSSSLWKL
eukprot:Skav210469  [mRNA]  locus=scaffold737:198761:205644:+ [translate_table: standard]